MNIYNYIKALETIIILLKKEIFIINQVKDLWSIYKLNLLKLKKKRKINIFKFLYMVKVLCIIKLEKWLVWLYVFFKMILNKNFWKIHLDKIKLIFG